MKEKNIRRSYGHMTERGVVSSSSEDPNLTSMLGSGSSTLAERRRKVARNIDYRESRWHRVSVISRLWYSCTRSLLPIYLSFYLTADLPCNVSILSTLGHNVTT